MTAEPLMDMDSTCFSLLENLEEAMKAMAVRAPEKNLELALDLKPGLPELVLGDPARAAAQWLGRKPSVL